MRVAGIKNQRGLSLLEVVLAISLGTIVLMSSFQQFMPWLQFRQKIETERRMEVLAKAIENAYQVHAGYIDDLNKNFAGTAQNVTRMVFRPGAGVGVDASDYFDSRPCLPAMRDTASEEAIYKSFRSYVDMSDAGSDMAVDGFGGTLCVYVSKVMYTNVEGMDLPYRNIAVVSKGMNNTSEVEFNEDTGEIVTESGSDDTVRIVSGLHIQKSKFDLAVQRLDRIAEAFSAHFQIMYLRNPVRDESLNYFNKTSGGLIDSVTAEQSVSGANPTIYQLARVTGLSVDDFKSPWFPISAAADGQDGRLKTLVSFDNTLALAGVSYNAAFYLYVPGNDIPPGGAGKRVLSRSSVGRH